MKSKKYYFGECEGYKESMKAIYTLKDPDDEYLIYVGLSKNPIRRYHKHISSIKDTTISQKSLKQQWVKDLTSKGKVPIFELVEYVKEDEADYWE